MEIITYRSIGIIRSPYKTPRGTPIQPVGAQDTEGEIEVFPDFADRLMDLDGFSHSTKSSIFMSKNL